MVQRTHVFAEHQTLWLNIKLLSITWNILMLWRIVELAYGVTWGQSRRNHQKKQTARQTANGTAICWGHDVIECEDCRETITWCSRCVEESSLRLAVKQSQFGKFLLFFPCWYCIYPLSFMKALMKIATRLDSTTVGTRWWAWICL